ncbi:MAG TPA: DUF3499 domain-containing protein [Dermatophilaceae bacterium]|nr:DUF3499 domain-containing protein [Dermatophilaceae bacterium]
MSLARRCTRTGCSAPAVATLTYVYSDRAAVLGPLATCAEPHTYDLCAAHATGLTAPRGWDVVRLGPDGYEPITEEDDLLAVVEAVRERPAGRGRGAAAPAAPGPAPGAERGTAGPPGSRTATASSASPAAPPPVELARRGHLRVLRGSGEG